MTENRLYLVGGTESRVGQSANYLGGTGGGGMDPWQQSVETRLVSFDARIGKVEERLGGVETSLATLTERVSHLPTKGWGVGGIVTLLGGFAAITAFSEKIQGLLGQG